MPAPMTATAMYAPPRVRSSTTRIGSSGCAVRVSTTTKPTSSTSPAAMKPSVLVAVQPSVSAVPRP
jgi:hypothetical protein